MYQIFNKIKYKPLKGFHSGQLKRCGDGKKTNYQIFQKTIRYIWSSPEYHGKVDEYKKRPTVIISKYIGNFWRV